MTLKTTGSIIWNTFLIIPVTIMLLAFSQSLWAQQGDINSTFPDVKTAKIILSESYDAGINFRARGQIITWLKWSGIKEDSANFDIIIKIEIEGHAIKAKYIGDLYGYHYTGAWVKGSYSFKKNGGTSHTVPFHKSQGPHKEIHSSYNNTGDAPLHAAFELTGPEFFMAMNKCLGVDPLIAALKSKSAGPSMKMVTEAMVNSASIQNGNRLIIALKDSNWYVRRAAALALGPVIGSLDNPRAIKPLMNALQDPKYGVREAVVKSLGEIGDTCAVDPLILALGDKVVDVKKAAIKALGEIGDPRAVDPLILILNDKYSLFSEEAVIALGEIGDSRAVEPLINALNHYDYEVRHAAVKALGEIGDFRAVEPLILALKKGMGRDVVVVLSKMTNKKFGYDDKKWEKWWQKNKESFLNK